MRAPTTGRASGSDPVVAAVGDVVRQRATARVAGWSHRRPGRPGSQDCAAWRNLEGLHAPAVDHDEAVAMATAKPARVLRERLDGSLDDLVLVDRVFLIP